METPKEGGRGRGGHDAGERERAVPRQNGPVSRSLLAALLLGVSAVASLAWLGWQATTVLAAAGGPPGHAEAELRILSGLLILGGWIVAWRLYRRSEEG
ncbi:MAG: hypothetical protein KatS3mg065_0994 [Chloroflexota bacterium]|nr:MAG: hypothetical protein KatS3mg065_0994 [Chloroflexota bacterium]